VVYIEPPMKFENTGDLTLDIRNGVQRIAAVLERYICRYPDQWLMFQQIWSE
jgi:lauroyl/myristoyl acyltransferase